MTAVIPVIDEADSLPFVLAEFPAGSVETIVVVDGGSTDGTVGLARAAGALVVIEPRRGYGRACLEGARATDAEIIVFLDGDGSDDPAAIASLVEPIRSGEAVLVLGARADPERGAQHGHQRLGNALVSLLVRICYGARIHDIPPMRAIRRDTLDQLGMSEMTYGWPTEMIVKTARAGLPIVRDHRSRRAPAGAASRRSPASSGRRCGRGR